MTSSHKKNKPLSQKLGKAPIKFRRRLRGSGTLIGNLEDTGNKIAREIRDSIAKTIAEL